MPNFKHDDHTSTYHGTIYNGWDVYTNQLPSGEKEVILRYGDEPDEYKAQPMHIALLLTNKDPDYDEAIGIIAKDMEIAHRVRFHEL
jgi:hypothetical protein